MPNYTEEVLYGERAIPRGIALFFLCISKRPREEHTLKLQQLEYFVKVAECGNLTEAANQLFIAQPSLSNAIHKLEKEMGIVAFLRSNKGVVLSHSSVRFAGSQRKEGSLHGRIRRFYP